MTIKVAEVTFTSELISEGSWGSRGIGKHESTMTLYMGPPQGCIEWDIPGLDETVEIGLAFEYDGKGALSLVDYDGVFSLPEEAVALLRKQGIVVGEEFE